MQKSAGFYDILKYSEDFFCGLLNLEPDYNFQVTNTKNQYAPDLLDTEKHIAVEITSSATKSKIDDIIHHFKRSKYFYEEYKLIILLLVSQKPVSLVRRLQTINRTPLKRFDASKDLLDITDMIRYIDILPVDELQKVYQYVCDAPIFQNQKQVGDGIVLRNLTEEAPIKSRPIGRISEIANIEPN